MWGSCELIALFSEAGREAPGFAAARPFISLAAVCLMMALAAGLARADAIADCNDADDPQRRISGCSEVIEADPPSSTLAIALMNRAIGRAAAGDLAQALGDLDAALEADPGLLAARYNRGNVKFDLGRSEDAIGDFTAVIERAPEFALAWLNRGLARERSGDIAGARRDFAQALALDKSLDAARRGVARLKREHH